jgi:hypothetical protein
MHVQRNNEALSQIIFAVEKQQILHNLLRMRVRE